ncbi:hypothetical protein ACFQ60_02105 [Streptomyces zhihengii]
MRVSSQSVTVVTLLADPDAPTEIAQRIAGALPSRLADRSGQGQRFEVHVASEPFTAGTEDLPTLMRRIMDRSREENWDIVIALTDLPLHAHGRKIVVDLSHEHGLGVLTRSVVDTADGRVSVECGVAAVVVVGVEEV